MGPPGEPLLCLEGVRVHFRARRGLLGGVWVRAVEGVSLTLHRGETLALVGESGSGKTTLGRASLRLLPLVGGRVVFAGEDVTRLPEPRLKAFRRRAQAVFQDPYAALSPYMRVLEVVEEPLLVHGFPPRERKERALAALEQVGLSPAQAFAERFPHTLSGGQRQRVALARALVLEPEYLVADEPVSMVDASGRAALLYLLRRLQEARGLALLYITHDLATARLLAHRTAVMYLGRVVELAPTARLLETPLHPYTQALLEAVPEPDPQNRLRLRPVLSGEPPSPSHPPSGCPFHPRCPQVLPGLCREVLPPLLEVAPGHLVACHLYPTGEGPSPSAENPGPRG
nr:ABC transporter ATP-binding protein [Thermus thermamylovorans]